jgi:hypothetical protein
MVRRQTAQPALSADHRKAIFGASVHRMGIIAFGKV